MNRIQQCNLTGAQYDRLAQCGVTQCVDIHCHCLPGMDDGPSAIIDALALCRALADDGITTVIATPHQLGGYDGRNKAADIRRGVDVLNRIIRSAGIFLVVVPGGDVRIDERIVRFLEQDEILTLADGGRYLLLELPDKAFIDPGSLIVDLQSRGVRVIVSHPERNTFWSGRTSTVLRWIEQGAYLQITAASLLGDFGPVAKRTAWHWLQIGAVTLVATDAHNTQTRRPRMSDAIDAITARMERGIACRVCIENPLRVATGQEIEPALAVIEQEVRE